jgi:hypothetical protein
MVTSTGTVSRASPGPSGARPRQNPPKDRRRPGRQPVSCAECRRSGSHLIRRLVCRLSFQLNIRPVRLKLKCDRKVTGIASHPSSKPDVVSSRCLAGLVGNEDVPRCVLLVSTLHSRIRSRMTSNALRHYFPSKALCPVARTGTKTPPIRLRSPD